MKLFPSPRAYRRGLAILSVGAVLGLAACSSGDTGADGGSDSGPTKITFSSWLKGSEAVVEAYNEAQDDVHVTFQKVASSADNYPQITNQVKAGTAPDVVTVEYPRVAEMAAGGVIKDISEDAADFVESEFPDSVSSLVQFGGSTWSVPYDAGVLQLFYRADLFEQYGIEVPATWEEYAAAAEKVKAADPTVRIGSTSVGDPVAGAAYAWQNGAKWAQIDGDAWKITIDDDATLESAAIQQDLYDRDLVWKDDTEVLQQKQADGKLLSVLSGSWYGSGLASTFPDQSGKWRVAPAPAPTDEPSTGMYGGSSFAISHDSEKVEAALDFIKWMTTTSEGVSARIEEGASTAFPANEKARQAAVDAFDAEFYGGQDFYEVSAAGLESIPSGWVWSPATPTTLTSLTDGSAKVKAGEATLEDNYVDAQKATVSDLEDRGINVAD